MDDYVEIKLTKGQAGYRGISHCPQCKKFIEEDEDSVSIEVNYQTEWVHLACFMEICRPIFAKMKTSLDRIC